jgi:inhibitor of KinA
MTEPAFAPLGDRAIMITLGHEISEAMHRCVRAACARIDDARIPGGHECVPAYASVAVHYDPVGVIASTPDRQPYEAVVELVRGALAGHLEGIARPERRVEIPVCYGGDLGPDLDAVAARAGLAREDVVRLHAGAEYLVYMVGFVPGFAYLGGLQAEIATPRRAEPRTHVPAGSVGIGGSQTGVYPMVSPGGWNLIGRTPWRMFDPSREPASLLAIGDRVRFRPISMEAMSAEAAASASAAAARNA